MNLLRRQCLTSLLLTSNRASARFMAHVPQSASLPWDDEEDLDSDTLPPIITRPTTDSSLVLRRWSSEVLAPAVPVRHWMVRPVGCTETAALPSAVARVLTVHHSSQLSEVHTSPGLVLNPQTSPSELLSVANPIVDEFIPNVTDISSLYDLIRIFEFPSTSGSVVAPTPKHLTSTALTDERKVVVQALRHEGVFKSAYWRTFKWDVFGANRGDDNSLLDVGPHATRCAIQQLPDVDRANLVLTTTRMFHSAVSQGFTRDSQMMLSAIGRLIDVAPFMNGVALADSFEGVKLWNRLHFALNEVIQDTTSHTAMPDTVKGSAESSTDTMAETLVIKSMASVAGPQSNLVDILLDSMEAQLQDVGPFLSVEQLLQVVEGLAFTGVRNPCIVATLANCTFRLDFTPLQTALLLKHAAGIHERIVEVLVTKGGPASSWVDSDGVPLTVEDALKMASPLFVEAAKKIQVRTLNSFGYTHPEVILALRRMCETNALVVSEVPQLWEEIRCIHIPLGVVLAEKRKRELGAYVTPARLQRLEHERNELTGKKFKAKPVVERGERRDLPPQFKKWTRDTRTPSEKKKQTLTKSSGKRSPYTRFGMVSTKKWVDKMHGKAHTALRY